MTVAPGFGIRKGLKNGKPGCRFGKALKVGWKAPIVGAESKMNDVRKDIDAARRLNMVGGYSCSHGVQSVFIRRYSYRIGKTFGPKAFM